MDGNAHKLSFSSADFLKVQLKFALLLDHLSVDWPGDAEVWQELRSLLTLAISVTFNVINRVQLYESSRRDLHIKVINASCCSLWQQVPRPPTEGRQHILQSCHSFQPFQPFCHLRLWEVLGLFIPVPLDPSEMLTVREAERPVSGSCWRLRALKHFWKVIFKRKKKKRRLAAMRIHINWQGVIMCH